jgi:hypothetical protein
MMTPDDLEGKPTPREDESEEDFIERCMSDDEAVEDFPDEDQRFAFCQSVWDREGSSLDNEDLEGYYNAFLTWAESMKDLHSDQDDDTLDEDE